MTHCCWSSHLRCLSAAYPTLGGSRSVQLTWNTRIGRDSIEEGRRGAARPTVGVIVYDMSNFVLEDGHCVRIALEDHIPIDGVSAACNGLRQRSASALAVWPTSAWECHDVSDPLAFVDGNAAKELSHRVLTAS